MNGKTTALAAAIALAALGTTGCGYEAVQPGQRALRYDPEGRASRRWFEFEVADYVPPAAPARPAPEPPAPKRKPVRILRSKPA